MKYSFVFLLAIGLLAGCKSVEPSAPGQASVADAPVMAIVNPANANAPAPIPVLALTISDQAAKAVQFHDQADVDQLKLIDGTMLEMNLQFGGGCEAHDILAFAQIPKSNPSGIDIFLSHNAHDDRCEAWLTRTYRIDLGSQIAALQQNQGHGKLQVRIFAPQDAGKAIANVDVPF